MDREDLIKFIEKNIQQFHQKRLDNLSKLKLNDVLKRKNPYLFKAKNQNTAADLIRSILDAHLSSQEEGIFGDFLEQLAIFICSKVYSGKISAAEGIDMEFERDDIKYIVSIKSGPNWGNNQQIRRMKQNFLQAMRILNKSKMKIIAVNGCCYGKDNNPDKEGYYKYCGQRFWELISGEENLYIDIIEPLGNKAKEKNEEFGKEYSKVLNRFILEFSKEYCDSSGALMWDKLVKFNSGK
jgi:hypothetical protein